MQDDIFIFDGVTHPLNLAESNYADARLAGPTVETTVHLMSSAGGKYSIDYDAACREWTEDDVTGMTFRESYTDVAVAHSLPVYFFKDGWCPWEKAVQAVTKYPNRYVGAYAAVDPLMKDPVGELERQAEIHQPLGVKLYPISYVDGGITPWRMDDPDVIFPIYEKARELGIKHMAVHKSVPLGPTPGGAAFNPVDIEGAATNFPDLTFEIVHGGMAFNEETAWLLGRFQNVWINMETLNIVLARRPGAYAELLAGMLRVGGADALKRIFWASGAVTAHPQQGIDAFLDFEFNEELLKRSGIFEPVPQLSREIKKDVLGRNLARLYGFDVDQLLANIQGDEFAQIQAGTLPAPYTTTAMRDHIVAQPQVEAVVAPEVAGV